MNRRPLLAAAGVTSLLIATGNLHAQEGVIVSPGGVVLRASTDPFAAQPGAGEAPVPVYDPEKLKLVQRDRELSGLIAALARTYRDMTEDAQRAQATEQLTAHVKEQFEIRQALRAKSLQELELRLARLRDLQAQRESQKDRIIGDRVQQVIRDAEGLGWGGVEPDVGAAVWVPDHEAGLLYPAAPKQNADRR